MHISRIFVYPIKSARPYEPSSAEVTRHGFTYDRRFMILNVQPDGSLKNMHIAEYTELSLLFADIRFSQDQDAANASVHLTWRPPHGESKDLDIPLVPDTTSLERIHVTMHSSPTDAYKMDDQYNKWLSACLGYDVVLAYLGEHERPVLMTTYQKKTKPQTGGWLSSITSKLPTSLGAIISGEAEADDTITFADCAPFLVVNETSLRDVSRRLPDGEEMDISKFRPNIIVSGAESSWEEDYWSELQTSSNVKLHLVQNCVRCVSLNVDYATGKPGEGESGKILKKLQSDRRVDKGAKYSPVFGRYAFLGKGDEGKSLSIGDEVTITQLNTERTTLDWPGIVLSLKEKDPQSWSKEGCKSGSGEQDPSKNLVDNTQQKVFVLNLFPGVKVYSCIMAERKVISKYYPPDFDPSKITRQRKTQSSAAKLESVRLSSSFSMRCNRCGDFIYKGRKFKARKQMTDGHYLNIPIVRLFIRCTACSSEIAFDTDFENEDYKDMSGATRNFEPWREAESIQETESERFDRLEREDKIP
ncbi:MOSC domain-containing protein, partial [Aureobasidium melanogenum]